MWKLPTYTNMNWIASKLDNLKLDVKPYQYGLINIFDKVTSDPVKNSCKFYSGDFNNGTISTSNVECSVFENHLQLSMCIFVMLSTRNLITYLKFYVYISHFVLSFLIYQNAYSITKHWLYIWLTIPPVMFDIRIICVCICCLFQTPFKISLKNGQHVIM